MGLKTIIIDDEADGAEVLKILLSKLGDKIELIGIANDLLEGVELIKEHKPQLVFLDVEMPGHRGYEIVDFFDKINFNIVFVTAYDEYAVKAFEINAVDYLLKPINRNRLKESVDKVLEIEDSREREGKYIKLMESLSSKPEPKIILNEIGKKKVVLLKDVIAIEASGPYSKVHLKTEDSVLVSKNLGYFEESLPEINTFFRTHKSWLINIDCIDSYQKSKGEILMFNNLLTKLSKYKKAEFEKSLL